VAQIADSFSVGPVLIYEVTDIEDIEKRTWVSAGVRPILHFNEYTSLAFEAGLDWTKSELEGFSDTLYKVTVAPQVSLGGRFLSRPVLRAFATYATWGDAFEDRVGGLDYLGQTEGFTAGMQMEAWW
jgi:maltoporin